jgi:hypothetical protein
MPARNDTLKDRLSRFREIKLSVSGRNSGRTISIPVWFVLEGEKLYLLPVQGSDTQWYKNVLKNPSIQIDAHGAEAKLQAVPITDASEVSSVVKKFREKYGASDVKKYYAKFDVAVLAQMPDRVVTQATPLGRFKTLTRKGGILSTRVVGLPGLAPSQTPQSARREDEGEAPEPAERPECPDEEEAAGGLGDLAVMCPPHVDDGHACREQPNEQHDDVPRSPFGEHQRPVQQYHENGQRNV